MHASRAPQRSRPGVRLIARRTPFHYAWLILLAGILGNTVAGGSTFWVVAVYIPAIAKDFDLSAVEPAALPPELRAMTISEQRTYIETKRDKRTLLQKKIEAVNVKRSTFLERERRRNAKGGTSLDDAFRVQVRKERVKKGYKFGPKK